MDKNEIGKEGERVACDYLIQQGFIIRDKNYRKSWGEIDIVAEKENIVHFVEVKTHLEKFSIYTFKDNYYEAEERVNATKKKRLARVIQSYLFEKNMEENEFSVDVIAVYFSQGKDPQIRLIEDIVL